MNVVLNSIMTGELARRGGWGRGGAQPRHSPGRETTKNHFVASGNLMYGKYFYMWEIYIYVVFFQYIIIYRCKTESGVFYPHYSYLYAFFLLERGEWLFIVLLCLLYLFFIFVHISLVIYMCFILSFFISLCFFLL